MPVSRRGCDGRLRRLFGREDVLLCGVCLLLDLNLRLLLLPGMLGVEQAGKGGTLAAAAAKGLSAAHLGRHAALFVVRG